jgi:[ribosomal protein S18]-alanine N-acetyltransferase
VTPTVLAQFHARCFTVPKPFSVAAFEELLAFEYNFLCSLPQGFALGRAIADEAELLTLAVDPDHRRHGTGRALLGRFEAEAMARGADRAFLEVAAGNHAAIMLYSTRGYTESGRRKGYYRHPTLPPEDAILMERRLTQN